MRPVVAQTVINALQIRLANELRRVLVKTVVASNLKQPSAPISQSASKPGT